MAQFTLRSLQFVREMDKKIEDCREEISGVPEEM